MTTSWTSPLTSAWLAFRGPKKYQARSPIKARPPRVTNIPVAVIVFPPRQMVRSQGFQELHQIVQIFVGHPPSRHILVETLAGRVHSLRDSLFHGFFGVGWVLVMTAIGFRFFVVGGGETVPCDIRC